MDRIEVSGNEIRAAIGRGLGKFREILFQISYDGNYEIYNLVAGCCIFTGDSLYPVGVLILSVEIEDKIHKQLKLNRFSSGMAAIYMLPIMEELLKLPGVQEEYDQAMIAKSI